MSEINQELVNLTRWLVIATFAAAFTALIVAIWGTWFRSRVFRPQLKFNYEHNWPDAIKIPLVEEKISALTPLQEEVKGTAVSYYFRFRVKNNGNVAASNVEVFVNKLEKKNVDGTFSPYRSFIPLNLGWSNTNASVYFPLISAKIEKHCDLGFVLHPQQKQIDEMIQYVEEGRTSDSNTRINFALSFVVKPNVKESYSLAPGVYRIGLVAVASNSNRQCRRTFELTLEDKWIDEPDEMLSQGIGLRFV